MDRECNGARVSSTDFHAQVQVDLVQADDTPTNCFQILSSEIVDWSWQMTSVKSLRRKMSRFALTRSETARALGISETTLWRYTHDALIHPVLALEKPVYSLKEIRRFTEAMGTMLEMEFEEPKPTRFAVTQIEVARWLGLSLSSVSRLVRRGLIKKNARRKITLVSVQEFLDRVTG